MKIMYLSATAGGVLKYIKMLSEKMKEKNNDIECFGVFSENHKNICEKDLKDMRKIYLNMKSGRNFLDNISLIKKLRKIYKEERPDILYIHGNRISFVSRIALIGIKNIRVVYNPHGWENFNFFEKIFAKSTDVIINDSKREEQRARKIGINPKLEMIQINNGIDFKKYNELNKNPEKRNEIRDKIRKELEIDEFQKALVQLGNINDKRDPFLMLNIALAIIKMGYNIKLVMIGDGEKEEIQKIMEFAEENNILDKIEITGWVDNLPEYLTAMDIALSTTKEENTPVILAEYMAAKLPIVTNNSEINAEILDYGKFGKIAESGDVEDYVYRIQEVFIDFTKGYKTDSSYRYAFENYNLENMVNKHIDIFQILFEERN